MVKYGTSAHLGGALGQHDKIHLPKRQKQNKDILKILWQIQLEFQL
jgi:hypothetical protein